MWDELGLWWRRSRFFLPKKTTWNVVGRAGDPDADEVVCVIAHHDAAHAGLIFDQTAARKLAERRPEFIARARHWPMILWLVFIGPLLVALGSLFGDRGVRRAGSLFSFGSAAAFADIGLRGVVPGANDNLSGVAAMLERRPQPGRAARWRASACCSSRTGPRSPSRRAWPGS